MRTYLEYYRILTLWDMKVYSCEEISLVTGFNVELIQQCLKEFQSLAELEIHFQAKRSGHLLAILQTKRGMENVQEAYSYLLGLYLGDGHISKTKSHRAHRIMIFLDQKYPKIIERCVESLETVFAGNKVGIVEKIGCVSVNCYSQDLPVVFPQHGMGKKHDRPIVLEDWQQHIVDTFPLEFFRGLYHSDGSRPQNIVKGKNYPRYTFSNESDDIRKLFTDTVEKLGLHWTTANRRNVAISKREDVEWLDKYVGAKA